MLISYKRGQGSIVLRVKILNSSVSTGAGLTGLTSASSGLIIGTIADNESTTTAYTVAGSTIETITTLGTYAAPTATKCRFKEVDSTNHKGIYEIQIADARFAVSSAKSLLVSISGATNAAECDVCIPLTDLDPYDTVRAGLTALPNVASGNSGAIVTAGTGTAQISTSSGQVLLQSGTGTGQVKLSSGYVAPNWGDVGNPTTVVNLSGTEIKDVTDIGSDIAALNNLSQANVRTAVGLGSANLDTQLAAIQADLPQRITKNTALAKFPVYMVDSTDHITPETGLTITATRSLDGGAFGACANSVTEIGTGHYYIDLEAADLNGNTVILKFAATGADTRIVQLVTQPT